MTGKLADTVMSVRNGEQIARKYQPVVYNPSTPAQIAQRAKMKLMSQLSAVLAPAIAIRRVGNVSSRNMFTKKNMPNVTYQANEASINLPNVQLTDSVVGIGAITLTPGEGTLGISLAPTDTPYDFDKVMYIICVKQSNNSLRYSNSVLVSTPGEYTNFPTSITDNGFLLVIYAYGIRLNSEAARVAFGNLTTPTAENVAKLLVTSTLLESDVTLSATTGIEYTPSQANVVPDDGNRSTKKR